MQAYLHNSLVNFTSLHIFHNVRNAFRFKRNYCNCVLQSSVTTRYNKIYFLHCVDNLFVKIIFLLQLTCQSVENNYRLLEQLSVLQRKNQFRRNR